MDAHVDVLSRRIADRLACTRCVGDPRLQAEAREAGLDVTCDYCGRRGHGVDVAWLADRLHALVQETWRFGGTVAATSPTTGRDAHEDAAARVVTSLDLVASAGRLDAALALDVHGQLATLHRDLDGSALYGTGCAYLVPSGGAELDTWDAFVAALDTGAARAGAGFAAGLAAGGSMVGSDDRALDALKWAFDDLDELRGAKGRAVVRALDVGTRLCAASPADAPSAADAVLHLATDVRTAIAELRPTNRAPIVVDRMRLTRECRVLDADALHRALSRTSAFTDGGWDLRRRAGFARDWRDALRRTPSDAQGAWPKPLRVVADWLAHGPSPRFDGVVTRSACGDGRKVLLFAAAHAALRPGRQRRYEIDGTRGYRRLDRSAEIAGRFAQADGEQRDDADAGHDDEFHGSPP